MDAVTITLVVLAGQPQWAVLGAAAQTYRKLKMFGERACRWLSALQTDARHERK